MSDGHTIASSQLEQLAHLLAARNQIDAVIGGILKRPMVSGHAGEWIAAQIFDIDLERNAAAEGIDGHFRSGSLAGKTVNVKWYLKREGILDLTRSARLDYYLVLAGPAAAAHDSTSLRPWLVTSVYLFDARKLLQEQEQRAARIGVASSIRANQWAAAEIYPLASNPALRLTERQREQLALFAG
jgi:hypothetical protein